MKSKAILGLIATATVGTVVSSPMLYHHGYNKRNHSKNNILLMNNNGEVKTSEAVVINGNNSLVLYGLSNGKGIVSYLSTGEMLSILSNNNDYYKVKVHETGAVGYISKANVKVIFNCENSNLTSLSGTGSIINVSSAVNLRAKAGINSSIIGKLHNGQGITFLGKQGQWYKVDVNGQVGYVYEEYVSTSSAGVSGSLSRGNVGATSSSSVSSNEISNEGSSITSSNNSSSITNNTNTGSKNRNSNHITVGSKNSQASNSTKLQTGSTTSITHNGVNQSNNINNNTENKSSETTNKGIGNIVNKTAYITNVKTNGKPIFGGWQLDNGQPVTILGEKGDCYKVSVYNDGDTGYINKKYITFQNNENEIHPNNNALVSKYFGTWTVGKKIGSTIGINGTYKSYEGKKVIITPSLYSFNGTVIKNPNYYIVTMNPSTLFGNSQYDNYGAIKLNQYGEMEIIMAVPNTQKVTNKDFIDEFQYMAFGNNPIIISGDSLVTWGGGAGGTSINQCNKGSENTTSKNQSNSTNNSENNGTQRKDDNSGTLQKTSNKNNKATSSNGSIKWVESFNSDRTININDVVVKNTTGNNISNSELAQFMRKWILEGQLNCNQTTLNTTGWMPQWLKVVSNNELINAFIEANGTSVLKNNITANEFNNAILKLYANLNKQKEPFTLDEATKLIKQLFPDTDITKVVPEKGCYYVYTKESGNNIYVVVDAYTGNYHS